MRLPWHPKYVGTCADTSDMTGWERFWLWIKWEARWTRRWAGDVSLWWDHNVRGFPKRPAWEDDPVAQALGFVPMKDAGRALLERQKKREGEI
jgi:hypothetical protein